MVLTKDMLSVIVVKAECDWLWHSGKIDNRMDAIPDDYLSHFVREKAKGMKGSMVGVMMATALCD
jgi:hypothetical protein